MGKSPTQEKSREKKGGVSSDDLNAWFGKDEGREEGGGGNDLGTVR